MILLKYRTLTHRATILPLSKFSFTQCFWFLVSTYAKLLGGGGGGRGKRVLVTSSRNIISYLVDHKAKNYVFTNSDSQCCIDVIEPV